MSREPSELNNEERALAEREAELAARERSLHGKERTLEDRRRGLGERAASLRGRAAELAAKAEELGTRVHEEVRSALGPHALETPLGGVAKDERLRSLAARRVAEERRQSALDAAELATSGIEETLRHAEADLAHRESSVAALAREVIRRERAELDRREVLAREMAADSRREAAERTARAREEAARAAKAPPPPAPPARPAAAAAPVSAPTPAPAAKDDGGDNRRTHQRMNVELDVTLSSEHNFFAGFTQNVSEGGLFIATHDTVDVGTELDIKLHVAGREIRARGRVAWLREYNVDAQESMPGLGVAFASLAPADHQIIQAFLRQRDPLFYEA